MSSELPEIIYHVRRYPGSTVKKPYYVRSDRRIYAQRNHVSQFLQPSPRFHFEVHALEPGEQWKDVTKQFVCEHILMECKVCGTVYDNDYEPPATCHNGDADWDVSIEQRKRCFIHQGK